MAHRYDFVANTTDGAYVVDRAQTIVLWNAAATRILGHEPGDVLGKHCYDVLNGHDGDGCVVCRKGCASIEAVKRRRLPPRHDLATSTKDGREIWLNVSTVVVPSRSGQASGLVHLFRDVTKRYESLRVLREFASVMGELGKDWDPPAPPPPDPANGCVELTQREREVLALLGAGAATDVIAERLCISGRTVRNHVNSILGKLGVHSRLEAVTYSLKNGLV